MNLSDAGRVDVRTSYIEPVQQLFALCCCFLLEIGVVFMRVVKLLNRRNDIKEDLMCVTLIYGD